MSIYKLAREYAGFTQDEASRRMFLSVRTLSAFDSGKKVPKDDLVCRMIEVYGTPWLAYQHLSSSTEVGRRFLPRLEQGNLAQAVLCLQKEMDDVIRMRESMVGIAMDGRIDYQEIPEWNSISEELSHLIRASLMLIFAKKEKGLQSL